MKKILEKSFGSLDDLLMDETDWKVMRHERSSSSDWEIVIHGDEGKCRKEFERLCAGASGAVCFRLVDADDVTIRQYVSDHSIPRV